MNLNSKYNKDKFRSADCELNMCINKIYNNSETFL